MEEGKYQNRTEGGYNVISNFTPHRKVRSSAPTGSNHGVRRAWESRMGGGGGSNKKRREKKKPAIHPGISLIIKKCTWKRKRPRKEQKVGESTYRVRLQLQGLSQSEKTIRRGNHDGVRAGNFPINPFDNGGRNLD